MNKGGRVAVCFSGQARISEKNIKYFIENIYIPFSFAGYDVDCFAHFWTYINESTTLSRINNRKMNMELSGDFDNSVFDKIDYFKNTLKPVNIQLNKNLEEISEFKLDKLPHPHAKGYNSQYLSIKLAAMLCNNHEIQNNFKYDYVVRIRPDISIMTPLNPLKLDNNCICVPNTNAHGFGLSPTFWDETIHCNDQLAISSSENMYKYSQILDYIIDNVQKPWFIDDMLKESISSERIFWLYVNSFSKIKKIDLKIQL
jgi:hypothetical protein